MSPRSFEIHADARAQVRFIFETFRRLHPGLPLMHLHGKQKQPTRLTIFQRFSSSKSALLICTDVAARGLDFPAVDWVVQLDCPEDVDTYIHRVGRTARYESEGKALLFLCPSEEEGMLARWKEKAIEVKKIKIKESKMGNLRQQMQNFAFKEPEIKYLGQRVSRDSKSLMASGRASGFASWTSRSVVLVQDQRW
jgi:ATP-dependent RNA helicase DDX10/DBP4